MEDVKLYEEHRCILESNKWVDDVLINASQFLLHSQYGRPGFQATTLAYNLKIRCNERNHSNSTQWRRSLGDYFDHWIATWPRERFR